MNSDQIGLDPVNQIQNKRFIFSVENENNLKAGLKSVLSEENVEFENFVTRTNLNPHRTLPKCSIILQNTGRNSPFLSSQTERNEPLMLCVPQGLDAQWKKRGLRIITLVARFIYQLKTKSDRLKMKLITPSIFQMIGDQASDHKQFIQSRVIKMSQVFMKTAMLKQKLLTKALKKYISILLDNLMVIQPESSFKILWDSILVFIIILNIFYIPMSLSFDLDISGTSTALFFETIPSYIFILEILLNFNTAYYTHGVIHTKRSEIFRFYIKGNFLWDLLIAIPFVLAQFQIPYIQFVLLLRVTRVRAMVQSLEDLLNLKDSIQAILELFKLVYFIVFVAHMCCCGWHLLGKIEYEIYNDQKSWLVHYQYYESPWLDRYFVSLYWSVITTLTVGYGDIVPQTTVERVFVVVVAMVICGVFGYTISTIGEILKNLEEQQSYYKQKMKEVNQYIKEKALNIQLSLKVRKYFEHFLALESKQKQILLDEQIMKCLTESLRCEVLADIYKKVVLSSQFLKSTFNDSILNTVCQKIEQLNFAPGDDVVTVNSQADRLIFIIDGQINSYSKGLGESSKLNSGRFFKSFTSGQIIGEQEFVMHTQYLNSYKAATFTQVAVLYRHDFLEILRKDRDQYIKFSHYKEKLLYSQSFRRVCELCNWTHIYLDCPFVFYQANRWKVIRKHTQSIPQTRNRRVGRRNYKFQTWLNKDLALESVIDFMVQNGMIAEDQLNEKQLSKYGMIFETITQNNTVNRQSSLDAPHSDQGSLQKKRRSANVENLKHMQRPSIFANKGLIIQPRPAPAPASGSNDDDSLRKASSKNLIKYKLDSSNLLVLGNQPTTPGKQTVNDLEVETSNFESEQNLQGHQNKQKQSQLQLPVQLSQSQLPQTYSIDIDQFQSYEDYYPNFNLEKVLDSLNQQKGRSVVTNKIKDLLQEKLKMIKNKSQKAVLSSIDSRSQRELRSHYNLE